MALPAFINFDTSIITHLLWSVLILYPVGIKNTPPEILKLAYTGDSEGRARNDNAQPSFPERDRPG